MKRFIGLKFRGAGPNNHTLNNFLMILSLREGWGSQTRKKFALPEKHIRHMELSYSDNFMTKGPNTIQTNIEPTGRAIHREPNTPSLRNIA